ADGVISASGSQAPAITAISNAFYAGCVSPETLSFLTLFLTLGQVPDAHGFITAGRCQAAAVRAERQTPDLTRVSFEHLSARPGWHIPQPYGVVCPRGCKRGAVGAERQAEHRLCMSG